MQNGLIAQSQVEDHGPEGIMIRDNKFVNVKLGIKIQNKSGSEPKAWILNNHINAFYRGIVISNKKFVWIKNNEFYNEQNNQFYQDIFLHKTEKSFVSENLFHFGNNNPKRTAVLIHETSKEISVLDNIFNNPGVGIQIKRGSQDNYLSGNRLFSPVNRD